MKVYSRVGFFHIILAILLTLIYNIIRKNQCANFNATDSPTRLGRGARGIWELKEVLKRALVMT